MILFFILFIIFTKWFYIKIKLITWCLFFTFSISFPMDYLYWIFSIRSDTRNTFLTITLKTMFNLNSVIIAFCFLQVYIDKIRLIQYVFAQNNWIWQKQSSLCLGLRSETPECHCVSFILIIYSMLNKNKMMHEHPDDVSER